MKRLLPYVKESSYDFVNDELNDIPDEEQNTYLEDILFIISYENRKIADYISDVLPDLRYIESQLYEAEKALLVYYLLDFEAMSENIMLPKVAEATMDSVNRDFSRRGTDYIKEKASEVKETNPIIYWYYLRVPTNAEEITKDVYNGLIVYNMLERQAEAELMKKEFKIDKIF